MSYSRYALKGDLSFKDIFKLIKFKHDFPTLHPNYFHPDGSIVFCGPQGSGKTLSAVKYVKTLVELYPYVRVVSNMKLNFCDYLPYPGLMKLAQMPSNGEMGTLVLVDEIQNEFSSLESKGIAPATLATICQQRKRRFHIVCTAQLFTRISKAFREQITAAVDCSSLFGCIQWNRIIDFKRCAYDINGNLTAKAYSGQYFWTRSPGLFDLYDTTEVIERMGKDDILPTIGGRKSA